MNKEKTYSNENQDGSDLLISSIARDHLIDFSIAVDPEYQDTWFHEKLANILEQALIDLQDGKDVRIILEVPPQHGKQLAHSTPILTTKGWKTHGEIKVGDFVFGRDGKPVSVQAVSKESIAQYQVNFTDGSSIKCHGNHEWVVYDRGKHKEIIVETKWLANQKLEQGPKSGRGHRYRFQVDSNVGVDFPHKNFNLHPYMLGVWLGDGKSSGGTICAAQKDKSVIEKIISLGYGVSSSWEQKETLVNYFLIKGLCTKLKKEGLINNKHIPQKYLISSRKQRMELLAGLIDTDGYVYHQNGRITFSNTNKTLIQDAKKLVVSLGWKTTVCRFNPKVSSSGVNGKKIVYQLCFNPTEQLPLALPRKVNFNNDPLKRRRGIVSITPIKPEKGQCIQVEGGIYLAGETLIPTHNSAISTIRFPAWALGKYPNLPIIVGSYSDNLAVTFGQATRDLMLSPVYQKIFKTKLRTDTKAKGRWMTSEGGGYTAAGAGGAFTGMGFKIGIIDDLFKNREEAESETIRESRWNWYKSTFYTRQRGNTAIIVIGTRWHLDDVIGRLLAKQEKDEQEGLEDYDKWTRIKFPAIATENEEHRKKGEVLWPERFSLAKLKKTENTLGPYEFSALYQQEPISSEHQEFKDMWLQYRKWSQIEGLNTRKFATIDPGGKEIEHDYTGIVRNYVDQHNKWNIKAIRVHFDSKELMDYIFRLHDENFEEIGVEETVYLQTLKPFMDEECRKRNKFPNVIPLKHHNTQKEIRIRGLIPRYSTGSIFHLEGECGDLEKEMKVFPKGANDDVLDALAMQNEIAKPPVGILEQAMMLQKERQSTERIKKRYGL